MRFPQALGQSIWRTSMKLQTSASPLPRSYISSAAIMDPTVGCWAGCSFQGNGRRDNRINRLSLDTVAPELNPQLRGDTGGAVLCDIARNKSSCWTSQIQSDSHHCSICTFTTTIFHSRFSLSVQKCRNSTDQWVTYFFQSKLAELCVFCRDPIITAAHPGRRASLVHALCMKRTQSQSHITGLKINKPVRQEDPNEINEKERNFHLQRTSGQRANQPFNAAHWTCKWETVWKGPRRCMAHGN